MAMYDYEGLDRKQLETAFNEAAKAGHQYLLLLSHSTHDVLCIREDEYTRSVATQDDIIPLLREIDRNPNFLIRTDLIAVLDVTRDFAAQVGGKWDEQTASVLSESTRASLKKYQEEVSHQRAVTAWQDQPWYARLFTKKPALARN